LWRLISLKEDHHENPRDKRYLKICFVCNDLAKPGTEHLRNYGGIVCYSCRAFWRRCHNKRKTPKFICKENDSCTIDVVTRRRCQKCRYERCVIAGMNADAVLDNDQKKVRFRKLLMKRQKQLTKELKAMQQESKTASRKIQSEDDELLQSDYDPSIASSYHPNLNGFEYEPHPSLLQTFNNESAILAEEKKEEILDLSIKGKLLGSSSKHAFTTGDITRIVDGFIHIMTSIK